MEESKTLKEEYNNEPVHYCSRCLSLRVKILNEQIDFCDECGCTDIETTDIENWKKLYKDKYGREY